MLIVSKFHDYYDTASIYGVDKTVVYSRVRQEIPVHRKNWADLHTLKIPDGTNFVLKRAYLDEKYGSHTTTTLGEVYVNQRVVGFCGKFYPLIMVQPIFSGKSFFFYDIESFSQFAAKEGIFYNTRRSFFSPRWDGHNPKYEQGLKGFFNTVDMVGQEELFHAFKTPVMILGSQKEIILNPCLKDFGFMKMKDPQTAFQDIYMYIGGVLGAPPKPKEKMSDEVLAAAKGHDGPYSFRKPPGKRGKKQWR